jgi:outer membrane murein-binding lipoprotein Lpp
LNVLAVAAVVAASLLVSGGSGPVLANACADGCRAKHNQCRMSTKNSPSCDAELQRCLQSCMKR